MLFTFARAWRQSAGVPSSIALKVLHVSRTARRSAGLARPKICRVLVRYSDRTTKQSDWGIESAHQEVTLAREVCHSDFTGWSRTPWIVLGSLGPQPFLLASVCVENHVGEELEGG